MPCPCDACSSRPATSWIVVLGLFGLVCDTCFALAFEAPIIDLDAMYSRMKAAQRKREEAA